MKMINRCFPSVLFTRAEGALCHVGLAERSDDVDDGGGAAAPAAPLPARRDCPNSGGISLMKGKRLRSSLLLLWSWG